MLSEKAAELGRMIGQSTEYQALKRANDALAEDKEVVAALQRMEARGPMLFPCRSPLPRVGAYTDGIAPE